MKKKTYLAPEINVVEIDHADIICTSDVQSQSMESYQEGNISDWY